MSFVTSFCGTSISRIVIQKVIFANKVLHLQSAIFSELCSGVLTLYSEA